MGAAKGTLRTGPMHTNKSRENQLGHSASGKLQANGANQQQIPSRQEEAALLAMKSGLSVQSAFTSGQGSNGELNIKATQIINPQKIVRVQGRPNLKTKNSSHAQQSTTSLKDSEDHLSHQRSSADLLQQLTEQVKEISLKVQVQDWRVRIEQIDALFTLMSENVTLF